MGASTLIEQPHSGETSPLNSYIPSYGSVSTLVALPTLLIYGSPKLTPWAMKVVGHAIKTGTTPNANLLYPCDPPNATNSIPQCRAPKKDRMMAP